MSASNTKWVRLGDYIELCDKRNSKGEYLLDDVIGISNEKILIPTKADMKDVSLTPYKIFEPGEFCYVTVTSRNGGKISLALNATEHTKIVSSSYVVFRSIDKNVLLPEYLFLLFNRPEFDRYARFNSWGSARETFDWAEMERVQIPLPPIEVQRELVETYNGLKALAEQNEALIPHLSAACHAYIADCQYKYPSDSLGNNINVYDRKNKEGKPYLFYGINKEKTFIPTVADTNKLDNTKYKVVKRGVFVFNGMHVGRDIAICMALYDKEQPILVSPAYTTFVVKNDSELLPEFLFLQLSRTEFGRHGWFFCDSSVRGGLDWNRFCEMDIFLPPIEVQQAIVDVFRCLENAKKIAATAREKLKTLCPALMQRATHS